MRPSPLPLLLALPLAWITSPSALAEGDIPVLTNEVGATAGSADDAYGRSMDLDGDLLVVGAPTTSAAGPYVGAVHLHERAGDGWSDGLLLPPPFAQDYMQFGYAVALSGDRLAVSAPFDDLDGNNAGSVFLYDRFGPGWALRARLVPADIEAGDEFGRALSLHGDTLLVGSLRGDVDGTQTGTVYAFTDTGTTWVEVQEFTGDPATAGSFGAALHRQGDRLIVGAPGDDEQGAASGAGYLFELQGGVWVLEHKLMPTFGHVSQGAGTSVAMDGDRVVLGAPGYDHPEVDSGRAYVFERRTFPTTEYVEIDALGPTWTEQDQEFGAAVAVEGDLVAVGSRRSSLLSLHAGTLYVFRVSGAPAGEPTRFHGPTTPSGGELGSSLRFFSGELFAGEPAPFTGSSGSVVSFGFIGGPELGTPYCFGDGSGNPCPCGNDASAADEGCLHSGGYGMRISACGSTSIAGDDLVVVASGCPPGNAGIFFAGASLLVGGGPLYDGLQCVSSHSRRFRGRFQVEGWVSDTGFVAQDPTGDYFAPGQTYFFQYWSRDVVAPSPCGFGANLSPGIAVTMTP